MVADQFTVLHTDSQGELIEPTVEVFDALAEAREMAAELDADNVERGEGGRYRVYRLVEVETYG